MCVLVIAHKTTKISYLCTKKHGCAAYKVHSWVSTDTVVEVTMNLLHSDTFAQTSLFSTFSFSILIRISNSLTVLTFTNSISQNTIADIQPFNWSKCCKMVNLKKFERHRRSRASLLTQTTESFKIWN